MLSELMLDDPLMKVIFERSRLREAQMDSLMIHLTSGPRSFSEKAVMRDGGPVSKGSFVRSLKQATRKCHEVIYTIILLQYLGLLPSRSVEVLSGISKMLAEHRGRKLTFEQSEDVKAAIDSAIESLFTSRDRP